MKAVAPYGAAESASPQGGIPRVLFVHGTLEIGGAEEVRLALLSHLDRSRYEATVCCLQRGGPIADEIAALGYEVIVLGRRAHAFSLPTLTALRRLIRERRPHIVQTSLLRANYWGRIAAVLERVPVVISEEHNVLARSRFARLATEQILGPRTDCAILVSNAAERAFTALHRRPRRPHTVVFPNPVNAPRLRASRDRQEVRLELEVGEDDVLLIHTGRMDSRRGPKGQDILIEALAALPPAQCRITCAFLGDGPARHSLGAMARKLGLTNRVRFLGYRREVADYLAAADIFVFPSRSEGMPIALMEAMWMGLPIVASDIPANRETLGQGEYGHLCAPESPDAVADAISRLAVDGSPRALLAQRAAAPARDAFSPERYAHRVSALWEELLASNAAGIGQSSGGGAAE